jgi:hypothetical protein
MCYYHWARSTHAQGMLSRQAGLRGAAANSLISEQARGAKLVLAMFCKTQPITEPSSFGLIDVAEKIYSSAIRQFRRSPVRTTASASGEPLVFLARDATMRAISN